MATNEMQPSNLITGSVPANSDFDNKRESFPNTSQQQSSTDSTQNMTTNEAPLETHPATSSLMPRSMDTNPCFMGSDLEKYKKKIEKWQRNLKVLVDLFHGCVEGLAKMGELEKKEEWIAQYDFGTRGSATFRRKLDDWAGRIGSIDKDISNPTSLAFQQRDIIEAELGQRKLCQWSKDEDGPKHHDCRLMEKMMRRRSFNRFLKSSEPVLSWLSECTQLGEF